MVSTLSQSRLRWGAWGDKVLVGTVWLGTVSPRDSATRRWCAGELRINFMKRKCLFGFNTRGLGFEWEVPMATWRTRREPNSSHHDRKQENPVLTPSLSIHPGDPEISQRVHAVSPKLLIRSLTARPVENVPEAHYGESPGPGSCAWRCIS